MLDINIETPRKAEIEQVFSELKRNITPGPAGITAKALLANTKVTTETLSVLFTKIWEEEKLPDDWKEAHLIKLPKKGDLSACNNYKKHFAAFCTQQDLHQNFIK